VPYSYFPEKYGFRNPGESSVREPKAVMEDAATQGYNDDDVLPLDDDDKGKDD